MNESLQILNVIMEYSFKFSRDFITEWYDVGFAGFSCYGLSNEWSRPLGNPVRQRTSHSTGKSARPHEQIIKKQVPRHSEIF